MTFIVQTGPHHPGIALYIVREEPPARSFKLEGAKAKAYQFGSRIEASAARGRFSSAYGLVVTEVNP